MIKYDLAICLPGIRTNFWERLYNTAIESIGPYSFEMVIVGPYPPPESLSSKSNFKFFKDYGSPTRCGQIATTLTESEFMTWLSDDCFFIPNSLKECLDMIKNSKEINDKDEMIVRYTEGKDYSGNTFPNEYWNAKYHADFRLNGIKDNFKIAPAGILKLDHFRWLGGWDCRYELQNMSCNDLSLRIQNNGGNLYLSPKNIITCNWSEGMSGDHAPIHLTYFEHDLPLFREMWGKENSTVRIDYDNWKNSPERWHRRFGNDR